MFFYGLVFVKFLFGICFKNIGKNGINCVIGVFIIIYFNG